MTAAKPNAAHRLQITQRPLAELTLNLFNPRRHDRAQLRKLEKSLKIFGFVVPILTDTKSQIVAGHGRYLAAKKLGLTSVPTIVLEHLSDAQLRAYNIADNRLSEISTWDDNLLAEQLKVLSELELDFDLEATAFDMGEIDLRIGSLQNGLPITNADEPEPAPAIGPPVTKLGDLWLLGRHRVLCGDTQDAKSFITLMNNQKATAIFSDPPFNVKIDGHASGLGSVRHREFAMASGEMNSQQFTEFLTNSFRLFACHSIDGSLHYICMDWRHGGEIQVAGNSVYSELKNICVWTKPPGMGSLYRSAYEQIYVFKKGHAPHHNNVQLGKYGRHRSNVWEYPSATAFGRTSEEGPLHKQHPTVKPIRLVADAIFDFTARGDLVLDGYLGSGTTLIAAERAGRVCYGLEIDPLYVDLVVRRWQAYTGEIARNARTQIAFDASNEGSRT